MAPDGVMPRGRRPPHAPRRLCCSWQKCPGHGGSSSTGPAPPPAGLQQLAAKLPAAKKSRVGETHPGVPAGRPWGPLPSGSTSPRSHRVPPVCARSAACTGQGAQPKRPHAHLPITRQRHGHTVTVLIAGSGPPSRVLIVGPHRGSPSLCTALCCRQPRASTLQESARAGTIKRSI